MGASSVKPTACSSAGLPHPSVWHLSFSLLVAALMLLLLPTSLAYAASPVGPSFLVFDTPGAMNPDADSQTIVWNAYSANVIWMYDVDAKQLKKVKESTGLYNCWYPRVSGDVIVWEDWRQGERDRDIYAYRISTGQEFPICTSPNASSAANQGRPDVSGDLVVWIDYRDGNGHGDIWGRYLNSGSEFPIVTDWDAQEEVVVSGNVVVWSEYAWDGGEYSIRGYDLAKKTEFPICTVSGRQWHPEIDGSVVVWQDERSGEFYPEVYGYDLVTKQEFPVASAGLRQTEPAVCDGIVIWTSNREANGGVWGYEVASGQGFLISTDDYSPVSAGSHAAWISRGSVPRLYAAPLHFWTASVEIEDGAGITRTLTADLGLSATRWSGLVTDMRFSANGSVWQSWAPHDSTASFSLSAGDGTKTVYAQFRDEFGGLSPVVSDDILLDRTAPVTSDDGDDLWHAAAVTLRLTPSDSGSGVASTHFTVDGGPEQAGTSVTVPAPSDHSNDSAHVVTYWSIDEVGNSETPKTCEVRIDTTPPASSATNADALWHAPTFVLTIASQDASSGVATIQTRVDGGGWTDGATVNCPEDGVHAVEYRAIDRAGNVEAAKSTQVKTDATPPSTACNAPTGWQAGPVTVQLDATDAGAGVAYTEYRLDEASWQRGSSVLVNGDGRHSLTYRSVDMVGNVEAASTSEILIDTAPPVTVAKGYAGWHRSAATVSLEARDVGAGVATTHYRLDGGAWQTGTSALVPAPSDHGNDGVHTVRYYSVDQLGHQEAVKSCTVKIDTRAPVVKARSGSDNREYPYARVKYSISESLSPDLAVRITIANSAGTVVQSLSSTRKPGTSLYSRFRCNLKPGTYSYRVRATDQAGNASSASGKLAVYVWWRDAAKFRGSTRTVLGPVKSTRYARSSSGRPTFLNIGRAYPYTPRFTAVIWGRDRHNFSVAPERRYAGHLVTVRGKIRMYQGQPQTFVSQPSQIKVLK